MRKEQGSITMIVFATVIFILIILGTTLTSMTYKRKSQAVELQDLKDIYSMGSEETIRKVSRETTLKKNILAGSGTEGDAYRIYTIEDLVRFSNRTNAGDSFSGKYVQLMKDLDFNQNSSYENPDGIEYGDINGNGEIEPIKTELTTGRGFTPIGNYNNNAIPFSGVFDGNKKRINNLYINVSGINGEYDMGLFGYSNGTIKDLYVTNANLTNGCTTAMTGVLAGNAVGTIQRCHSTGRITINGSVMMAVAGGLVGIGGEIQSASIDRCYTDVEIVTTNNSTSSRAATVVGGVVGQLIMKNQILSNCYSKGNITITTKNAGGTHGGGIIGELGNSSYGNNLTTKIQKCYSRGIMEVNINGTRTTYTGTSLGYVSSNCIVENVFSVDDSKTSTPVYKNYNFSTANSTNLETVSTVELCSLDIMQKLGEAFVLDSGYPVLTWQVE